MLVLVGQKHLEWDGKDNSNQPSFGKFVYATTAWKLGLEGCMSIVIFREKDEDQITKKWDTLIKDYQKIKVYIENTTLANWWRMNKVEKKELSRNRKISLKFSEPVYNEMEEFVARRQIFHLGHGCGGF